ncbi:hypothetical protein F5Y06DRAFT_294442 [Hypoxylon sp. FL0890]|nr:hypothetical protein F5Y06DRAFT_294442 [Hypoxylon sp. FL0890]
MNVMNYYCIVFLFCLLSASLVAAEGVPFSVEQCPWFYLRQGEPGNAADSVQLLATCIDDRNSNNYSTSAIDLDKCLATDKGLIEAMFATINGDKPLSGACSNCGLAIHLPGGDGRKAMAVAVRCLCVPTDPKGQNPTFDLDDVVTLSNGVLGCQDNTGIAQPYDTNFVPRMVLPQSTTTTTATATTTATQDNTVTSTATITVNSTVVSTAISTDATTAISISTTTAVTTESPTPVTVTEKPKKVKAKTKTKTKTHKVTETHNVTETAYVTAVSTSVVTVTMTPTYSHTIFAEISDSHIAVFSTSDLPPSK